MVHLLVYTLRAYLIQSLVHQTWVLRHHNCPVGCFLAKPASKSAPAELVRHPMLQIGLGSSPKVEVRVKVSAQPFNIQQGLLQHNQLRLYFNVELAGCLKQPEQYPAKGDFAQGFVENRLAYRTYRRFKLVYPCVTRRPTSFYMRFRHAFVIATEKCKEVLREIILVLVRQRAHYAEVDSDVTAVIPDKNVTGMHVGMKISVPKHLSEKNFDADSSKPGNIYTLFAQLRYTTDGDAFHPLHNHHA